MKVLIKEVIEGTVSSISTVLDYYIKGTLQNGKEIEIVDFEPFHLKKFEGKEIDLLFSAWIQDINTKNKAFEFTGQYIENYNIPSYWFQNDPKLESIRNEFEAIKTQEGIFLTDYSDFKEDIKDGEVVYFNVIRFDLFSWRIEDFL